MKIDFYKKEIETWLLDPKEGFSRKRITFEVRKDPLTGSASRILPFRFRPSEKTQISQKTIEISQKDCPFCPDRIIPSTPQFIPEMASEGRIQRGEAILFPNSFPYAQYNWVVVLSEGHFLYLDQFNVEILRDGFLLAQYGVDLVKEPEFKYSSINWNYLPQAGGGIIHPHIQLIVEDIPTTSHKKVLEGLRRYQKEKGSFFWEDFLTEEIKNDKRYIGNHENVHFLTAFSPMGILGEILILVSQRSSIKELNLSNWESFSEGLVKVFGYFKGKSIESFNLSIFSGGGNGVRSWVYGRLCPRITIPPWNTSDINYFEKLHDEVVCVVSPEEMCEELKASFCGDKRKKWDEDRKGKWGS
jgi:galactose-1-phosphate uridylyltransferase